MSAPSAISPAILDGTPVDWQAVESTANETERPILEELRLLATLVDFHRERRAEPAPRAKAWGHLRVLEPIGSGASCSVPGIHVLDREVALKLLPADSDGAKRVRPRSSKKADSWHACVIPISSRFTERARIGDTIGLWMKRIDGETVEQRLSRESPLNASHAIEIGIQICHAVSAVHKAGLLHRDIKAQNVMLARMDVRY